MAAGFVTGQQKADDRLKISKRAFGGYVVTCDTCDTCDNGGSWNYSLQKCDCLAGFSGRILIAGVRIEQFQTRSIGINRTVPF